jgi:hypothetical protein
MEGVKIRRRVLLGGAAGSLALGTAAIILQPRLRGLFDPRQHGSADLPDQLRRLADDHAAMRAVAEEARQALEVHGRDWPDLPSQLMEIRAGNRVDCDFESLIRDDFRNQHTVPVFGWVISRTEAELVALLAPV